LFTSIHQLIVHTPKAQLQIISGLVGRHNVYNILAAVATGLALGAPLDVIVGGIEAVEVVPGR
jgi:UDP-N-acetylmuramyl tripeptide synthase